MIVMLAISLVMSVFAGSVFANGEQAQSVKENSTADYVKGQLVVSVEPQKEVKGKDFTINSKSNVRANEAKLNNKGFNIVDALHEDGDAVTAQSLEIELNKDDFTASVIENMGLTYLVEYNESDYKNIGQAKKAITKELKSLGYKVRYVQPNYIYTLENVEVSEVETQDDASVMMHPNQRWHYQMVRAPQAWNITEGSRNVRIAVLDTGIDHNHPNLRNLVNTSAGRSFVGGTPIDRHGHGTHVAGTIASYGSVSGVMKSAELVSVKVLGDTGGGSMYGITQGILYSAQIGSDVINMSLGGGGFDRGMDDACRTAVANGTIVVAASGNDGRPSISYPAAYSSVIAVGSVTSNGTRSNFSNYGQGLDLVAPGSNIYSTYPGGGYRTLSGTSMASPHVAGVLGLMRAVNPNISPAQARNIIRNTAQSRGDTHQYGAGIVNAHAAVVAAGGGGGTPPPPGQTNTALTTDKQTYERGDNVQVTATVTNQNNNPLQGATVQFRLTRPDGSTVTGSGTTNASGVATWTLSSSSQTQLGTFTIRADASMSGYESSHATTTIQFVDGSDPGPGPGPEPPEGEQTFTTVTTSAFFVRQGESVTLTATVRDENNQAVNNATVQFTLTRPNGTTTTNTVQTNSNGVANWQLTTSSSTAIGTYTIQADTSKDGYTGSSHFAHFMVH